MARVSWAALIMILACVSPLSAGQVPDSVKRALAARDYETAANWLQAHREEADAAFELARLYRLGRGVVKDTERAAALFEVAANEGRLEAQYLLGKHFERKADLVLATRWMREAADGGHRQAERWLADKAPDRSDADLLADLQGGRAPSASAELAARSVRDSSGRTLLMIAAESNPPGWVDFLIEQGADLDLQDRFGATALHIALASRQFKVAVRLLDAGADPAVSTTDGTTPLHQAVAAGESDLARRLLQAGADANTRNQAGWSPRMLAERTDSVALQNLFLVPVDRDRWGSGLDDPAGQQLQLFEAARRGDVDLAERLLLDMDGKDKLSADAELLVQTAVERGDVEMLKILLDSGISGDAPNAKGRTPLIVATSVGCAACVASLIEVGVALDHLDQERRSALIVAARDGRVVIASELIASGAALNLADAHSRTALWWASRSGHTALAVDLLGKGALPAADRDGVGPLHLAAERNDARLVSRLTTVVDVNIRSGGGNTPLLLAAHAGAEDAASALIEAGTDIEARNRAGDTALIAAVRAGHLETSELLILAGASSNTRNERFESATEIMELRKEPEWQALVLLADRGMLGVLGSLSN